MKAQRHAQCAWCGRLKHHDGRAHGPAFDVRLLARLGYSHGACRNCKAGLLARRA